MYLTRAVIRNIRSISSLDWDPDDGPGWHVVLGDNGSGKSSFLRCLALALIGPTEAVAARQDWNAWLRSGTDEGLVRIYFRRDARHDKFSVSGPTGYARYLRAGIQLVRVPTGAKEVELSSLRTQTNVRPDRQLWGSGSGWFSTAYGPFRRFTGGDKEAERSFLSNPKLGRHISVFGENVALTEGLYP